VSCYWTFVWYSMFILVLRTASYEIVTENSRNIYRIEALVASVLRRTAAHKHGESNFTLYLHYLSFSK